MNKQHVISEDTQIHMTSTYSRQRKGEGNKTKRAFNFVIKGLLISTALVSAVVSPTATVVNAESTVTTPQVAQTQVVKSAFQDEAALVMNLKMANKVLDTAIKTNQMNINVYTKLMKSLTAIEAKLAIDGQFQTETSALHKQINNTTDLIAKDVRLHDSKITRAKTLSIDSLNNVKQRLGMEITEISVQPSVTTVAQAKVTNYTTTYNGVQIAKTNKSISVSGKYLVPANEVLKKAGASVSYNSKTKTLTIKAGTKTTTHKQGTNYAYINKKKTTLSTKSMVYKGVTMVPYDLVSKATTAKVTVSSATKTVKITKTVISTPTGQTKPNPLYQGHDYGARNSVEYIKTMDYVNNYLAGYKTGWFRFGGEYPDSYKAYFKDGAKAPAKADYNMSDYQYGLVVAEGFGKDLRANKVDYNTIIKLDEVGTLAQNILADANYRDYGASKDMYSAYQLFFEHRGDCDSRAHAMQVVFDKYGFTTQVKYSVTHADLQVKIEGHWYVYDSGSYQLAK